MEIDPRPQAPPAARADFPNWDDTATSLAQHACTEREKLVRNVGLGSFMLTCALAGNWTLICRGGEKMGYAPDHTVSKNHTMLPTINVDKRRAVVQSSEVVRCRDVC